MARTPTPTVLENEHVVLRPTDAADGPALFAAFDDASVWTWLTSPRPATAAGMQTYVDAALAERVRGTHFPWTVRVAGSGVIAGWSSYGDIEPRHERIEIGWTAYAPRWQRTAVNTATKLLLLGHAFDDLGYERVSLKTDGRNERSQAAILRLGATYEGTLRSHSRRGDGTRRDTVYFSILRAEWPAVRANLAARLNARPAHDHEASGSL